MPGWLQTGAYARATVRASRPAYSDDAVERTGEARIGRKEILTADAPPMLWYVIHEGVLRHLIGSPDVMADQLDKLLATAARPGVLVQVLPFIAHDHAGVEGPVSVYDFDDSPAVGYTECHRGGRIVESQAELPDLTAGLSMPPPAR